MMAALSGLGAASSSILVNPVLGNRNCSSNFSEEQLLPMQRSQAAFVLSTCAWRLENGGPFLSHELCNVPRLCALTYGSYEIETVMDRWRRSFTARAEGPGSSGRLLQRYVLHASPPRPRGNATKRHLFTDVKKARSSNHGCR